MANLSSTFEQLHAELGESLAACRDDADSRAVHSLRTTSRRIEALLRAVLEDHPRAQRLRRDSERALRPLKKVRAATGPVRDLDVQRRWIAEIAEAPGTSGSAEEQKRVGDECRRLDKILRHQRDLLAVKLSSFVKAEEPKLQRALEPIPSGIKRVKQAPLLVAARRVMLRSSQHLGGALHLEGSLRIEDVSRKSLHRYRKETKAARYLVEMNGTSEAARSLAKRLKRVLDAIGRWHDLMLLAKGTKTALGKRSRLAETITMERDRALRDAVRDAVRAAETRKPSR